MFEGSRVRSTLQQKLIYKSGKWVFVNYTGIKYVKHFVGKVIQYISPFGDVINLCKSASDIITNIFGGQKLTFGTHFITQIF